MGLISGNVQQDIFPLKYPPFPPELYIYIVLLAGCTLLAFIHHPPPPITSYSIYRHPYGLVHVNVPAVAYSDTVGAIFIVHTSKFVHPTCFICTHHVFFIVTVPTYVVTLNLTTVSPEITIIPAAFAYPFPVIYAGVVSVNGAFNQFTQFISI
jgi:hypothetical protein